jgi:hypothetical protein
MKTSAKNLSRITKPLLYQLSYVGTERTKHCPAGAGWQGKHQYRIDVPAEINVRLAGFPGTKFMNGEANI